MDGEENHIAIENAVGSVRMEQIAQFLPVQEHAALYEAACANQELFHPPGGAGSAAGGTVHWSRDTDGRDFGGSPLREAIDVLGEHILERLPFLFTALGVEPFPVARIPLNLIHGLAGHRAIPHMDSTDSRFEISLLYYFHRVPKMFRGGDLEIYETVPGSVTGHGDEAVTKIEHQDNLLIAFPSRTFHAVTEVLCDSREFADGRFTAVGFLGAR